MTVSIQSSVIHLNWPQNMPQPSLICRRVAVIGAGAAGLVAARELRKEGHIAVVFEKDDQIGGTWVYTPRIESDLLGINPSRAIIHSSIYESLRTNLPRELMGFMDFPFLSRQSDGRDPRRFPSHREVLLYLQEFAKEFKIEEMVRFNCEVVNMEMVDDNGKWKVKSKNKNKRLESDDNYGDDNGFLEEVYDAVVVCNGHYTEPRIAEIPGINVWPGKQIHSHNYRTPEPFRDQVIVIIGNANSTADLSVEIAGVAKEVHIVSRSVPDETNKRQPGYDNIWLHSMIKGSHEDGTIVFRDGSVILADIILHCTGYKYHFPFLETRGIVTVDDNRLGPLYKHVFPPVLAPWLSFVGIPWKVIPFPQFEFQSKWIAGVLSGRILLPSQEEMMEDVNAFYSTLEASDMPKRYTHNMRKYQFEYNNWLAAQCQCPGVEEWRRQMYRLTGENKIIRPNTYRDEWEDDHLILEAYEDFKKYT
ncbi:flavin-containing monooxygenase FMO GS-OX-like 4 isoform X3 [Ricinus communis]|uniref:flavin-containing monooxygenase FMO GS-OX-like 4 isoform X3 n=1 Tax=Ricinus communis TaxID=3988 RepID=UPI000772BF72|nr:flavin-containing monooxygenase FMO GS-OX-like 4 isoform X3 [Ricinus communis]|eukprot:XP_015581217.1 flavin-containing monooxygenase FMO GS-OX-like 4 isoform X1 [Ricinus communis]